MKYILLTLLLVFTSRLHAQELSIDKLNNQLNQHIESNDNENIIKTILDLKLILKKNKLVDPLTFIYLDARLTSSYNSLNQYEKTLEIYKQFYLDCNYCDKQEFINLYGIILNSTVSAYSNIQQFKEALKISELLKYIYGKNDDLSSKTLELDREIERAIILIKLNELDLAEKEINTLINFCKDSTEKYNLQFIRALSVKGQIFTKKSDLRSTLNCLIQIDRIFEESIDDNNELFNSLRVSNCLEISQYYSNVFDYKSALIYAKKAVYFNEVFNIQDHTRSLMLSNLAFAYFDVDSLDAAYFNFEKAIIWNQKQYGENTIFNITPFSNMALIKSQTDFEESILLAKKGIKIVESNNEYYSGAESLFKIISDVFSNPNYSRRNKDSTMLYAVKYKNYISQKLGENSEEYFDAINQLGYLFFQFNEYNKAINYQLEYRNCIIDYYGKKHYLYRNALNSLAFCYKYLGNISEAEIIRLELARCWNIYIKDNYTVLVGNLQNNQSIIDAINQSLYFVDINQKSFKMDESKTIPYENLLLVKNLQLSSLKALRQDLKNNISLTSKLDTYIQLKTSGNSTNDNLKISQLETELLSNSKIFKEIQFGKKLSFQEVKKSLKLGQLFIDFARIADPINLDNRYVAIIYDRNNNSPTFVSCGLEKSIINNIINKDVIGLYNEIWQYLEKYIPQETYELILSPIYELNNISFASICENNVVSKNENSPIENQINRGRVGSNKTINSCNYLIDKYSIRYVQSARSILKEYDKLKLKSSVLAIGGVDYNNTSSVDTENYENKILNKDINSELSESIKVLRKLSKAVDFEFLPNTEIEVDEIAEECREKSWKVKLLKSQYADESNLINTLSNNSFEILHFATHGFSFREDKSIDYQTIESYKDPLNRCGLIMAGGNKSWSSLADVISIKTTKENDGILTGNEVLNLPLLQTKLVVLSACETSIGKIEGMESSLSLNRMFLMSGVEYVISSLWPVPDLETMELMTLFYSDLTKTLSPIISFEKAQKEIRYKYPTEPEKWAGFVLVR